MFLLAMRSTAVLVLLAVPIFAGDKPNTYLALGDSVAFGYDPTLIKPGEPLPTPDKFTGYPEVVANMDAAEYAINAACPGQTSKSFLIGGWDDNGCEGFRNSIGLHTKYKGTQDEFAFSQLKGKKIGLVTLSIGGNDLLLLQQRCAPPANFETCVGLGLPAVLATYGQNLAQILFNIRYRANYKGTLVIVNSYTPSANPLFITAVGALNLVMVKASLPFGAKFADAFTAFRLASGLSGDPCKAGLIIPLGDGTCDVHPTKRGRDLIAATVEFAIHAGPLN